jgi:hypothetical protein
MVGQPGINRCSILDNFIKKRWARTGSCWSLRRRSGKFGKPSVAEETKMSKARLIKRREWLEREQVAQRQTQLSSVAQVRVDTVRNWVKGQRASRQPNAREMFAALFAQAPTIYIETGQP